MTFTYDSSGHLRSKETSTDRILDTCYLFSPEGLLLETVSPRGSRTRVNYDGQDRVTSIEAGNLPSQYGAAWSSACPAAYVGSDAASGTIVSRHFNADHDMDSETDGRGSTVQFGYDGLGRVVTVQQPAGTLHQLGYDDLDHVRWAAAYYPSYAPAQPQQPPLDPASSLGATPIGLVAYRTTTYDPLGRPKEVDVAGFGVNGEASHWLRSSYIYDRPNRQVTITDAGGASTAIQVDGAGNVVHSVVSDVGGITEQESSTFDYAAHKATSSLSAPVPGGVLVAVRGWNSSGLPTTVTSAAGDELSRTVYDSLSRLQQRSAPGQGVVQHIYDGLDHVRVARRYTVPPAPVLEELFDYDPNGNLITRPGVQYTIDALDRVTRTDGPGFNNSVLLDYEGASPVVRARRTRDLVASFQRDGAGRLQHENDFSSSGLLDIGPLPPDYFSNGTPTNLGLGQSFDFLYDPLGRLVYESSNNGGPMVAPGTMIWNSAGQLTEEIGPGSDILHVHDQRGLVVADSINGVISATRTYDASRRLATVTVTPQGFPVVVASVAFGYSGTGGPTTETRGNGLTTYNTYDALGRLVASEARQGATPVHAQAWGIPLDGVPRTETLSSGGWSHGSVFAIDELGRVLAESHDVAGTLPEIPTSDATAPANDLITSLVATGDWKRYTLDGRDNLLSVQTPSHTDTPAFDDSGRYFVFGGQLITHGLDGSGQDGGGAISGVGDLTMFPNALGQTISFGGPGIANLSYAYDGLGRLTGRALEQDVTIVGYDGPRHVVEDRGAVVHAAVFGQGEDDVLAQMNVAYQPPDPGVTEHVLDLDPPRTVTVAPSMAFGPLGFQSSVTVHLDSDTGQTVTCTYLAGTSAVAAFQLNGCDGGVTAGTPVRVAKVRVSAQGALAPVHRVLSDVLYSHRDRMGSIAALSDETGSIVELYDYKAYGARTIRDATGAVRQCCDADNVFGFQGHPHDSFTGFVDMRNRMYWPYLGQFLSPDPAGFAGGSNLYAFARGAPLLWTDPFGLSAQPTTWAQRLTSNFFQDVRASYANQVTAPGSSALQRINGALGTAFTTPFALSEQIVSLPGAFAGNVIDQTTLRSQGRDAEADAAANAAGVQLRNGLLATSVLSGGAGVLASGGGASSLAATEGAAVEAGETLEVAGSAEAQLLKAPFNPSGSVTNCVGTVCAFLNSVKGGELVQASENSAENLGRIARANAQIAAQTGVTIGKLFQTNTLDTTNARQFFVVYPGVSTTNATHVLIGIVNYGTKMLYDPQTGQRFYDLAGFGNFVAFPVKF